MKTQSYQKFRQRLHNFAKEENFPLRVMFELTYRCNFKCRHCYVPNSYRKRGELKTREIFSILDQLAEIGCFYLGFTGGEPFVRNDLMDILRYAKRKGFEIIIYSNGSLIDERIADELSVLRPNKVDITIPAVTKDAFEKITRQCGSYSKVFKAINLLHKKGVNLGFKTCILKENHLQIKDIRDFAFSMGALHRLCDLLSARLDGSEEPFKYGIRGSSAFQQKKISLLSDCSLPMQDENQIHRKEDLFKCGVGETQAAITPTGELKMCVMIGSPSYRIFRGSNRQKADLEFAWKGLRKCVALIKPKEDYRCHKCNLQPFCQWCPARGWLFNGSFSSCEPMIREKAEQRFAEYQLSRLE